VVAGAAVATLALVELGDRLVEVGAGWVAEAGAGAQAARKLCATTRLPVTEAMSLRACRRDKRPS